MEAGAQDLSEEEIASDTLIGGRYRIVRKLATGGMGVVYRATHEITHRPVALKIANRALANDRVLTGRFVREARAVSSIHHPHAIEVLDVFEDESIGRPVMVMELLEGEELSERIERGPLTVDQTAAIFVPVLEALAHAHAKGIVHRDLKPDNIFLARSRDGTVVPKVLDFGIAKIVGPTPVDPTTMRLTRTGMLLGTPHFMSPEQVSGMADVDHRADLWSVGVALYECLTGELPFHGENFGQVFAKILQKDPTPLPERVPNLPERVVEMVHACLEKDRDDRPESCAPIAELLAHYADLPIVECPPPAAMASTSSPPTMADSFEAISEVRSSREDLGGGGVVSRAWIALVVAAALTAFGVAWWVSTQPEAPTETIATESPVDPPAEAAEPEVEEPVEEEVEPPAVAEESTMRARSMRRRGSMRRGRTMRSESAEAEPEPAPVMGMTSMAETGTMGGGIINTL